MSEKRIVVNRIKTPDGTILTSRHVHDYVTYLDNNGEEYMVDGGHQYLRRNVNIEPFTELSIFSDAPFEVIRQNWEWGTYGKNSDQPLSFVKLSDMSDAHVNALLGERYVPEYIRDFLFDEMAYRHENKITIKD